MLRCTRGWGELRVAGVVWALLLAYNGLDVRYASCQPVALQPAVPDNAVMVSCGNAERENRVY